MSLSLLGDQVLLVSWLEISFLSPLLVFPNPSQQARLERDWQWTGR